MADFTPANFVTGTGRINGRKVVVGADDFTIRGGAADAAIAGKQVYAEQLANQRGCRWCGCRRDRRGRKR